MPASRRDSARERGVAGTLLTSIFAKGIRDQWKSLVAWMIAVAGVALAIDAFYPSIKESMAGMQQMADNLPQVVRDAFFGSDMTSAVGWLDTKLMSMMAPIMFLVYAIGAGGGLIAGEEERGTLDLLLAQPVSRRRVLLQKYGDLLLGVALLTAALFATLALTGPAFQMHIGAWDLLQASLLAGLLGLAFGSIAFLVAAGWGRRGLASGVAGGLAGVMYVVNILAAESERTEWLRTYSLFHYYGVAPVAHGLSVTAVLVFGLTAALCLLVADAVFSRRDIG